MKAKVLKQFKDKHSGEIHQVGSILTISRERYEEILTKGHLVEEIKPTKKPQDSTE